MHSVMKISMPFAVQDGKLVIRELIKSLFKNILEVVYHFFMGFISLRRENFDTKIALVASLQTSSLGNLVPKSLVLRSSVNGTSCYHKGRIM